MQKACKLNKVVYDRLSMDIIRSVTPNFEYISTFVECIYILKLNSGKIENYTS